MKYAKNIIETIGNTPLVKLNYLASGLKPTILVKLEYFNPAGSMKDRMAHSMIIDAEQKGLLKKGDTIVEPTSGNTGAGLAMIAALKGYKLICVMTEKVSNEKELILRAYGAEVVRTRQDVDKNHPEYYINVAKSIAKEKKAFMPYQYSNPANPLAYYQTTGPEIWRDTDGKVTHFIATTGTGGSISGTAKYLKEMNKNIKVIGADPEGSLIHHYFYKTQGQAKPYLIEGPGQNCLPEVIDFMNIDELLIINDKDSFDMSHKLAKKEGIFVGGSGGMAVFAALQIAKELTANDLIVVLLPDSGYTYLSKFYDDNWMRENNLL